MGGGERFADQTHPRVVIEVGKEGDKGVVEISDLIFATRGPGAQNWCLSVGMSVLIIWVAAGAIVVQWNVSDPPGVQGGSGMWDSHIRLLCFCPSILDAF